MDHLQIYRPIREFLFSFVNELDPVRNVCRYAFIHWLSNNRTRTQYAIDSFSRSSQDQKRAILLVETPSSSDLDEEGERSQKSTFGERNRKKRNEKRCAWLRFSSPSAFARPGSLVRASSCSHPYLQFFSSSWDLAFTCSSLSKPDLQSGPIGRGGMGWSSSLQILAFVFFYIFLLVRASKQLFSQLTTIELQYFRQRFSGVRLLLIRTKRLRFSPSLRGGRFFVGRKFSERN